MHGQVHAHGVVAHNFQFTGLQESDGQSYAPNSERIKCFTYFDNSERHAQEIFFGSVSLLIEINAESVNQVLHAGQGRVLGLLICATVINNITRQQSH